MEKEKTDGIFEEMNAFLSENTGMSEAGAKDPDDDGLPYESLDDFSTEPAEFGELAERMLHKVENLFDLTAVYNRHSGKYLKACILLEKGIKFLGGACLTKIALEHEKYTFPELSQLSTMKLYRMASFNYRKLDAALTEKLEKRNDLYPELLDMEFRYFNLLRRLRSTETKIYNYHMKKYYGGENYDPVIEGNAFTERSWTKCYTQEREEAPAFRNAPAFPMAIQNQKSEIRNQKSAEKVSGFGCQVSDQSSACDAQTTAENQKSEVSNRKSPEKTSGFGCQVSENTSAVNTGLSEQDPDKSSFSAQLSACSGEEDTSQSKESDPQPEEEKPAFAGIIENVVKRSEENEDGALSFTLEEIDQLADDPVFRQCDPDMAAYLWQIREQIKNSS